MKTIHPATQPGVATFGPLKVGDHVRVETSDHKRVEFEVRELTVDTILSSSGARYDRADIVRLQRRSFSVIKTVLLVGGIYGGLFVLGQLIFAGYPGP